MKKVEEKLFTVVTVTAGHGSMSTTGQMIISNNTGEVVHYYAPFSVHDWLFDAHNLGFISCSQRSEQPQGL